MQCTCDPLSSTRVGAIADVGARVAITDAEKGIAIFCVLMEGRPKWARTAIERGPHSWQSEGGWLSTSYMQAPDTGRDEFNLGGVLDDN